MKGTYDMIRDGIQKEMTVETDINGMRKPAKSRLQKGAF